jgi:CheY-like chemotaxis protein
MKGRKRILVVDDEKPNIIVLQAMLKALGHDSESAENGHEALEKLASDIDLVLLDVMMPEMDGFEVAQRIREHPECSDVPIIMVTILTSREDRLRAVEAGANDFITKPVDKVELRIRTESVLRLKAARDTLRESEARYRTLVENSPVGIVSCDLHGVITEINPAAVNLLDISIGPDSEAPNLLTVESLVESGIAGAVWNCIETNRPSVGEFSVKIKRHGHVRAYIVPMRTINGRMTGAQVVLEDVSHYKRTEELRLRSERLKALVEMAEGAGGHFNDALQVIAGGAQMASSCLEARNYSAIKPYLERIQGGAERAAQTVRLLQQFAHARSATDVSQWRVINLGDAVSEAVERSAYWWKTKPAQQGIGVTMETEFGEECYVEGEREEIVELVVNLLKNAAEAVPAGGTISVKTYSEQDRVLLEVQDDGIGIPRNHIEKVGEPFWSTKPSHAGLGLAVSFGIVRRHLGTAAVTSKKGRGTTLHVKLPRVTPPTESQQILLRKAPAEGLRILLIDDDERWISTLESELRPCAGSVVAAKSSHDGVREFAEHDFDAVVCALDMDGLNGLEVAAQVHYVSKQRAVAKPAVILLCEPDQRCNKEEILSRSGVDRILTKPVQADELLDSIHDQLAHMGSAAAFSGVLGSIDILEVAQLMLHSGQQLVLEVQPREGDSGQLFVDKGRFRHAVIGDLEGEEALYRCLSFKSGNFTSLPWREPSAITIDRSGEFLLLEAARRRDEAKREARG